MKQNKYKLILFLVVFAFIAFRWMNVPLNNSGYARSWFFGDGFSSKNAYSAALFFKDSGFAKTAWLPVLGYKNTNEAFTNPFVYTHYPALPDLIAGVIVVAADTTNPRLVALFPLFLSVIMFFMIFNIGNDLFGNKRVASISATVLLISNYYICWADDIHQHVYTEFLKWLMFYLLLKYYKHKQQSNWITLTLGLIFLLQTNLSFEPIFYTGIVFLGFIIIYKDPIFSWKNVFLFSMPIIGFALHLFQNYLYFESWNLVWSDMNEAFLKRTAGINDRELVITDFALFARLWLQRFGFIFSIPAILFFVLVRFAKKELENSIQMPLWKVFIVFFIAGVSWNLVMTQHALIHIFTLKHMAIPLFLVAGLGIIRYKDYLINLKEQKSWIYLSFNIVFLLYCIGVFCINHIYFVYLKYSLCYPFLGNENYQLGNWHDYLF